MLFQNKKINKKQTLSKNTIFLFIGTALNKGILLIAVPLFSRWLSVEEYGMFDVYSSYLSLIIPAITLSIGDAVFRFSLDENQSEERRNKILSNGFLVEFIAFGLLMLGLIVIFNDWKYIWSFSLFALGELWSIFLLGYLRSIKRIDFYSVSSLISTIFTFFSVFVFVKLLGLGFNGLLLGYAFGRIIEDLVIVFYTRFFSHLSFKKTIDLKLLKKMCGYSLGVVLANVSWWIVNVSDRFLINVFMGDFYNGIYSAACKIPNLITTFTTVFFVAWQQEAVEKAFAVDKRKTFDRIYNRMFVLLLTIGFVCLAANNFIFGYFFDVRYRDGANYSQILISSSIFQGIVFFFSGLNVARKKTFYNSICVLSGALLNFLINIILIKYLGLYAASISTLISYFLIFVLSQVSLKAFYRPKYNRATVLCFAFYLYFIVSSIFKNGIYEIIINMLFSIALFFIFNKDIFISFLSRTFKNKST